MSLDIPQSHYDLATPDESPHRAADALDTTPESLAQTQTSDGSDTQERHQPGALRSISSALSWSVKFVVDLENRAVETLAAPKLRQFEARVAQLHQPVPPAEQLAAFNAVCRRIIALCNKLATFDFQGKRNKTFAPFASWISDLLLDVNHGAGVIPYVRIQVLHEHCMHAELTLSVHWNARWTYWAFSSANERVDRKLTFLQQSVSDYIMRCCICDATIGQTNSPSNAIHSAANSSPPAQSLTP